MDTRKLLFVIIDISYCILWLYSGFSECIMDESGIIFNLQKQPPDATEEDVTQIVVGDPLPFRLEITFPPGTVDMIVELLSRGNEFAAIVICDSVKTSAGANIVVEKNTTTFDSLTGGKQYDRTILDFGNVTSEPTCKIEETADCMLVIEYEVIMLQYPNSTYISWLSAGAEYMDRAWIGQTSIIASFDNDTQEDKLQPTFDISNPSEMAIGSTAKFSAKMHLPYPSSNILFDAFAPFNMSDGMYICKVKLVKIGENLMCGFDPDNVQVGLLNTGDKLRNTQGHMDIGRLVNKRSRETRSSITPEDLVEVAFYVTLVDDPLHINQTYWVSGSFDIGGNETWDSQVGVVGTDKQIVAPPTLNVNNNLSSTMTMKSGTLSNVNITIDVPIESSGTYELVITVTSTDTAVDIQLCNLFIIEVGENFGCLSKDASAVHEKVDLTESASLILNNVVRTEESSAPGANAIRIQAIIMATSSSVSKTTSVQKFDVSLYFGKSQSVKTSFDLELSNLTETENIDDPMMPKFDMSVVGKNYLTIGATQKIILSIDLQKNYQYSLIDVDVVLPVDASSSILSVCRLEVGTPGDNVFCIRKNIINNEVDYKYYDTRARSDRAIMKMGVICDIDKSSAGPDVDNIPVMIYIKIEDTASSEEDVSVGVTFSDSRMWVARMGMEVKAKEEVGEISVPHIHLERIKGDTPVGYIQRHNLLIKTHRSQVAALKVKVVPDSSAKVKAVDIILQEKGKNLPCVREEHFILENKPEMSLDLGLVTNVENGSLAVNDVYDDDSLIVELILQLAADVVVGVDYPAFDVFVAYNSTHNLQESVVIVNLTENTSSIDTDNTAIINVVNFTIMDDARDVQSAFIGMGEVKIAKLYMDIKKGIPKVTATFEFDKRAEICDAFIGEIGQNMPGVRMDEVRPIFSSLNGSEGNAKAEMDFGYVYSSGRFHHGGTMEVRVAVKIPTDASLTKGDNLTLSVTVSANGNPSIASTTFTVGDESVEELPIYAIANATLVELNVKQDDLKLGIGEVISLQVILHVPKFTSSRIVIDIKSEIEDTAALTVNNVIVVDSGKNIACLLVDGEVDSSLKLEMMSTYNTTQNDTASFMMGSVTNHGATHISNTYTDGDDDDDVIVNVTVQMADTVGAVDGAGYILSVGARMAGIIYQQNCTITVNRSGTEKPGIVVTAMVNPRTTVENIYVNVVVKHEVASSAEGHNISAFFYLPTYIDFVGISNESLPATSSQKGTAIEIKTPRLFFTDIFAFTLELMPNTNMSVPAELLPGQTVMLFEAIADMHSRSGNLDSNGYFSSGLNHVFLDASTLQKENCSQALGLESGEVKECQIESSVHDKTSASNGRLGNARAWEPYVRHGRYSKNRYFQVDFLRKTLVRKINVENTGSDFAEELTVVFSHDGKAWSSGEVVNLLATQIQDTILHQSVASRYIRLYVTGDSSTSNRADIGLRFELYGCYRSVIEAREQCDSQNISTDPMPDVGTFYFRSFVGDDLGVFVCDADPVKDFQAQCFSSADGMAWNKIDERVGSLIGMYSDGTDSHVYAFSTDRKSVLMSKDRGVKWASIPPRVVQENKGKSTFKSAVDVPWTANISDIPESSQLTVGKYSATYIGLHMNDGQEWVHVYDWSDCCV